QVGKNYPAILMRRISRDFGCSPASATLGRPMHALAVAPELPTVIHAADVLPFHPSGVKLRTPMSAGASDQVGASALSSVEGEVLGQDAEADCLAFGDLLAERNRVPKLAQKLAHRRIGGSLGKHSKAILTGRALGDGGQFLVHGCFSNRYDHYNIHNDHND